MERLIDRILYEEKMLHCGLVELREYHNISKMIEYVNEHYGYMGKCKIVRHNEVKGLIEDMFDIQSDADILDILQDLSERELDIINIIKL